MNVATHDAANAAVVQMHQTHVHNFLIDGCSRLTDLCRNLAQNPYGEIEPIVTDEAILAELFNKQVGDMDEADRLLIAIVETPATTPRDLLEKAALTKNSDVQAIVGDEYFLALKRSYIADLEHMIHAA